jgi:hypothetical protein
MRPENRAGHGRHAQLRLVLHQMAFCSTPPAAMRSRR